MANFDAPIPVSEIECVLAWVDTFKLSRPTKKINRDFSDAGKVQLCDDDELPGAKCVLLAEILSTHYPKLVEMHNYPPRNSHALKLNNWMTLNRKVLKKLKLNLCTNTMEQLSNSAPGVIERVLYMVREKIKRDDELHKATRDAEQNMSSGGSYYEALADDDSVLIVPVRTRVNGVLETIQQKVVNYDLYNIVKEELKDTKESVDVLKQKVDHLDSLLKLRDERIDELQKQLERKTSRKKEIEAFHSSLKVPLEIMPLEAMSETNSENAVAPVLSKPSVKIEPEPKVCEPVIRFQLAEDPKVYLTKVSLSRTSIAKSDGSSKTASKTKLTVNDEMKLTVNNEIEKNVCAVKSDIFEEAVETKALADVADDEFKDSIEDLVTTIEDTIQNEINEISNNIPNTEDINYVQ